LFEPALFQVEFGAALSGAANHWSIDPSVARALAIHRNTSTRAAMGALGDNYPVIRALVGEEAFNACALRFVAEFPITDPRLCLYGESFSRFLAQFEPFAAISYLPDMALLERLVTESLFAAEAPRFSGAVFDLERPLPLQPATRLARFASPVVPLWLAHQDGADPAAFEAIEWTGCTALVTRPADVAVTEIDAATAQFVDACAAGLPLAEAASRAENAGGDLAAIFAKLITLQTFQPQTDRNP